MKFDCTILISWALIPFFFGLVILLLLLNNGSMGDELFIPLLIIAGVFALLWMVASVAVINEV